MAYPKVVKEYIDFLNTYYVVDEELEDFDIVHMYPENKPAYPNGYHDSRFFRLIGFNTKKKKKRDLDRHDSLDFDGIVLISQARIFCDGSTLLKFKRPITISMNGQAIEMERITRP